MSEGTAFTRAWWEHAAIGHEGWEQRMRTWAAGEAGTRMLQEMYACFQNPDRVFDGGDDPAFRVLVPMSGGLDSSTAFAMAYTADMPVRPVYVDTGAAYADVEYEAAQDVLERLTGDRSLERMTLAVDYKTWDYVDAARNAIIVYSLARKLNGWGELWFGNNAQWRESQQTGSDKCARFFADMQALLHINGMDVRIVNPLAGMEGGDLIAWWDQRGLVEIPLEQARSCYDPTSRHGCGQCRSCLFRWLAFAQYDADLAEQCAQMFDAFDASVLQREVRELREQDMTTGPQRTLRLLATLAAQGLID